MRGSLSDQGEQALGDAQAFGRQGRQVVREEEAAAAQCNNACQRADLIEREVEFRGAAAGSRGR